MRETRPGLLSWAALCLYLIAGGEKGSVLALTCSLGSELFEGPGDAAVRSGRGSPECGRQACLARPWAQCSSAGPHVSRCFLSAVTADKTFSCKPATSDPVRSGATPGDTPSGKPTL